MLNEVYVKHLIEITGGDRYANKQNTEYKF